MEELNEYYNGKQYNQVDSLCYKRNNQILSNPIAPYLTTKYLDALPFPDKDVYLRSNEYAKLRYLITTSRGCIFNCTYCANNVFKNVYKHEKHHFRRRSPEAIINELLEAKKRYNIKCVWFMDDLFTYDPDWLNKFSILYKEKIRLPAEGNTHPALISEEIADMLKEMNMKVVALGIQTADEQYRKKYLRRSESNETVQNSVKILKYL